MTMFPDSGDWPASSLKNSDKNLSDALAQWGAIISRRRPKVTLSPIESYVFRDVRKKDPFREIVSTEKILRPACHRRALCPVADGTLLN